MKKVGASGFQRALARLFVKYAPAEWLLRLVDCGGSEIAESVKSAQVQVSAGLNEMVKQAHIKTLLKTLIPEPRVEYLKQLNWYVRRPAGPLILGDVCCLFQISNSRYVSIAGPSDGIQRIYLPLADDCIVVGTPENEIDDVCATEINEASAKVSRNYFISSVCSPDRAELSKLIDTEADIMTPAEMEQILTEVMSESVSKKKTSPDMCPRMRSRSPNMSPWDI